MTKHEISFVGRDESKDDLRVVMGDAIPLFRVFIERPPFEVKTAENPGVMYYLADNMEMAIEMARQDYADDYGIKGEYANVVKAEKLTSSVYVSGKVFA